MSKERADDIAIAVKDLGIDGAAERLGISRETVRRSLRLAKQSGVSMEKQFSESELSQFTQFTERFTEEERRTILNGKAINRDQIQCNVNFDSEEVVIRFCTDTHIGAKHFLQHYWESFLEECEKQTVGMILHGGDLIEGMSNRPGHVYELSDIGYASQKAASVDIFKQWTDTDIYAIDGNHDRWFIKSNGAKIVEDISKEVPNFHFLGHDEGDISLKGKATLKLWHGEDGNSYALSYRLQKILESLTGGEKPNAMLCGHTHKFVDIFERHVFCTSIGSMQSQTPWMRGKRIAAHTGFAIIDYWVNDKGICKKTSTWHPFYS